MAFSAILYILALLLHLKSFLAWEFGQARRLHGKGGIVGARAAFISSANLTDDALNRNMEFGILIRGGGVPRRLSAHFANFRRERAFVPVKS